MRKKKVLTRHKIVLKKMSENVSKGASLEKAQKEAGYSDSYSRTGRIKDTESWQTLIENQLPDQALLKIHKEGLEAVKKDTHGNVMVDYSVRHKYLDSGYKLKKKYDTSITVKREFGHLSEEELNKEIENTILEMVQNLLKDQNMAETVLSSMPQENLINFIKSILGVEPK